MPHWSKNAIAPPTRPSTSPSTTKGQRMKKLLAPTIFIMPISSRRLNVASLMVFCMMKMETMNRMTMRIIEITLAMLRTVMKP